MLKNINATLALLCFLAGLALLAYSIFQAPVWVQNFLLGIFLIGVSKKFIDNTTQ